MIQGIKESKLIACIIGGAGLFILIHALLSPMGLGDAAHTGICSSSNVLLAILGTAMSSGGFTYVLFGGGRWSPAAAVASYPASEKSAPADVLIVAPDKDGPMGRPSDVRDREHDLILRLLSGDERTMFRTIAELGGEALQKDLILRTNMSNAKVSRILDRLEGMGLITKERYGSTNRVEIIVDEGMRPNAASSPSDRAKGTGQ